MKTLTILIPMHLAGQGETDRHHHQAGYAMAALIVGLSVMALLMTVAMPVWKQTVQREKEEELVFRGEQIARSVGLYQRKFANAYPPSIDTLVEGKFLRKKYKDPIANDDFVPLTQSQTTPQGGAAGRGGQPQGQPGTPAAAGPSGARAATPGGAPAGGIVGVTSKSKDVSIRLYKGRSHYNEWAFVYTAPAAAGGGATGAGGRGQPGQRGNQPGGNNPPIPGGGIPGRGGRGGRGGPFPPGGPNGPGRGIAPETITLPNGRTVTITPGGADQPTTVTTGPGGGRER